MKRLVLWHDTGAEPFRDFRLHRGLNIIWSPDGETAEYDRLPSGHAAGKTLFCRDLRHCLGEVSFAAPEDAAHIRAAFPRGVVGAEVVVDEASWAVRRPFVGGPDLAVRDGDLLALVEDASASFADYLTALQGTLGDSLRLSHYPEPGAHRPWQYTLAWPTRDQECRVEGIGSWRHKDTGSRSPVRSSSADARLTVLRLALDANDASASERASKIEVLGRSVGNAEASLRRLAAERDALVSALASALDRAEEEVRPPEQGEGLWMDDFRNRTKAFAAARIASMRPPTTAAVAHLDDARLAQLDADVTEQDAVLNADHSAVVALRDERALHGKRRQVLERGMSEGKHPTCPYDGALLDVEASRAACPLVKFPDPAAVLAELEALKHRHREVEDLLAEREPKLTARKRSLQALRGERDTVARRVRQRHYPEEREGASHDQDLAAAWGARSLVDRLLTCLERVTAARRDHGRLAEQLQALRDAENESCGEQDLGRISSWFQALVHRILGNHVTGVIRLDGNGLHADVQQRSVALNSLKVVLFDLAAMLCAAEERAFLPAFLLHDSPREGDLDPSTYRRIFRAVHAMAPASESAPFQYIITTTSPPPDDLAEEFVRSKHSAMPAKRWLYGIDL